MYIHSNKEIDKKVNVSKIANNINTMGDDSTEARSNSRLITVLVQHDFSVIESLTYGITCHPVQQMLLVSTSSTSHLVTIIFYCRVL